MTFATFMIVFLLAIIADQLRAINRHHKGLKIMLDTRFKLIWKKLHGK